MVSVIVVYKLLREGVNLQEFYVEFKKWQREKDALEKKAAAPPVVPTELFGVLLAVVVALTSLSCSTAIRKDIKDLQTYCCEAHPEKCVDLPFKIPCPSSTPTPRPTVTPAPSPTHGPAPTATPTSTTAPTATPTAVPTAAPPCFEAPPPPSVPVSLAFPGSSCPRGFERIESDASVSGSVLCVVKSQCDRDGSAGCREPSGRTVVRPAWKLGYDLNAGHRVLQRFGDAWLAFDGGRGCTDAYGRHFPESGGCQNLYVHPEGPTAPWSYNGFALPLLCPDPIPAPTPDPPPTTASCEAVERVEHFMAPGDHCHAWNKMADGRIRCLVDSTVRPICDLDHMYNWVGVCGRRFHDPDYSSPDGAQDWIIEGAEDDGPNQNNYAQRHIVGRPGASVRVTVCLKSDAVTPDGCRITPRGQAGCGSRPEPDKTFILPSGE